MPNHRSIRTGHRYDPPLWFWHTTHVDQVSQANIKLEAYGFAIADATKALEIDPDNVKVRQTDGRSRSAREFLWSEWMLNMLHAGILQTRCCEYRNTAS
jgi:hypothetical protein